MAAYTKMSSSLQERKRDFHRGSPNVSSAAKSIRKPKKEQRINAIYNAA
jgi:hypothetical protein